MKRLLLLGLLVSPIVANQYADMNIKELPPTKILLKDDVVYYGVNEFWYNEDEDTDNTVYKMDVAYFPKKFEPQYKLIKNALLKAYYFGYMPTKKPTITKTPKGYVFNVSGYRLDGNDRTLKKLTIHSYDYNFVLGE